MSESQIFLGPLETLLADGGVTAVHITETAVNFEKAGVMHASDIKFESDDERRKIIDSIVAAGGDMLSSHKPIVNCVLEDGTQVHGEFSPLSLSLIKSV